MWEALLRIPPGRIVSYGTVARLLGVPGSSRAVGRAVGENKIAYLIPCHRVIRRIGAAGEYRWGKYRKRAILGREIAREITTDEETARENGT
ncbi:MAG: methylated-DNA--[protein]-cysteine S-methyltransferase [Spirochaetia bacterium]